MAISNDLLRQYAQIAGGRGSGEQALAGVASAGLGAALASIPGAREKLQMTMRDSFTNPFQPLQSFFTSDVSTWKDLDEMPASAGEAYKGFSQTLSGRQKRIAKREGLLDPIGYVQKYNQRKSVVVPLIAQQLQGYAAANPDEDMEKLMRKLPNLRNYLNNNLSDLERAKMPYLTPSKTALESIQGIGEFFENRTNLDPRTQGLGSFATNIALMGLPPVAISNLSNLIGSGVTAGIKEGKTKDLTKEVAELGTVGAAAAATENLGLTRFKDAAKKAKSFNFKSVPDTIKKVSAKFEKDGASKVIKKVVNKVGLKKAGMLLAKLGLGTVGGVFSGGALTAAMGALAVKDIIDIANIILED